MSATVRIRSTRLGRVSPAFAAGQRAMKRLMDIVLALWGLVVLAPLLLLVAIAVKIDSPGPVLFRQTRHGLNGQRFDILKFRTMNCQENGACVRQASVGDPRVTPVGRWLRRSSIDELPQLVNVLRGDMSIVGPRPHAAAHNVYYADLIPEYVLRHRVRPGITGWAQVNNCRGETPTLESMRRRVELDIWYIDNWSITLDLQIIMKTGRELTGTNVY